MPTVEDYKKELLLKRALKGDPVSALNGLLNKSELIDAVKQQIEDGKNNYLFAALEGMIAQIIKNVVDDVMANEATQEAIAYMVLENIKEPQDGQDGIDGYTPIKGKDYFTKQEIKEFKKDITPVKGKDYFLQSEIDSLAERIKRMAKPIAGVDYIIPRDGTDGKDGNEIEGEDIVKRINDLPIEPEKQIDAKHIKNLPRESVQLGGLARGGVKLIWNTVLTGTVDGANTVFTIPATKPLPKADTNVVIEARGNILSTDNNDFTISGRTVTFVTAPPNGSNPPRVLIYEAN